MIEQAKFTVFAGSGGREFAERICACMGVQPGASELIRFSEGNTFVRVDEPVRDRDVFLVQPIGMASNDEFVEILFWMDAFKRASANRCTLIMPYFSYAKGDRKDEPRVSIRARVCAECMELAGCDHFMTMDLHSPQIQGFFKRPMDHLRAMPMLAEHVRRLGIEGAVAVSPNAGRVKMTRKFAAEMGFTTAIADKIRSGRGQGDEVLELIGDVEGRDAVIVDELSSSGGTLVSLARCLKKRGARRVWAVLSHNVLSESGVRRIEESDIEKVISTDTVDNVNILGHERFETISVAPLFAESIRRYYDGGSIDGMLSDMPESLYEEGVRLARPF